MYVSCTSCTCRNFYVLTRIKVLKLRIKGACVLLTCACIPMTALSNKGAFGGFGEIARKLRDPKGKGRCGLSGGTIFRGLYS